MFLISMNKYDNVLLNHTKTALIVMQGKASK